MATPPADFSAQVLGQTEKALNAILDRHLAGTGLTEPQWVTLRLAVMSDDTLDRHHFARRVTGGLKISDAEAQAHVDELAAAQLLQLDGDQSPVTVTDAGHQLHSQILTTITPLTRRLWGDLPAEDLAAAGRVLSIILQRADAELAAA
jgi:hypothetical protein